MKVFYIWYIIYNNVNNQKKHLLYSPGLVLWTWWLSIDKISLALLEWVFMNSSKYSSFKLTWGTS